MDSPSTRRLRPQLQALGDSERMARIDRHLSDGNWPAAIDELNALDADVLRCHRGLSALAVRVNSRHWSPLLEGA